MAEGQATTPSTSENEENRKTWEERFKDFGSHAISLAPLLCGIGIAIWWIFYGMVQIYPVSLGVTERIGLTLCTVFLAVTYCKMISTGGFQAARETQAYVHEANLWNNAIKRGNPSKKEIIAYATEIAKENQKNVRIENLEKNNLVYDDLFNANGDLIKLDYKNNKYNKKSNPTGYTRHQIHIITKCVNMRIEIPEMFGNISSKYFGIKKRITQREFEMKSDIKNTIVRIVIAVFSVGFMFNFMGFNFSAFIYALFQVVMWTGSGILARIKNYNFIMRTVLPDIVEYTLVINGYCDMSDEKKKFYEKIVLENEAKKKRLSLPEKTPQQVAQAIEDSKLVTN